MTGWMAHSSERKIARNAALPFAALMRGRVLRAMKEAQNDMNIVILDSCRNNPCVTARSLRYNPVMLPARGIH